MTARIESLKEMLAIVLEYYGNTASVYSDETYTLLSKINNTSRILLSNEHIDASNSYLSSLDTSYDCEIETPTRDELEILLNLFVKSSDLLRHRSISLTPACTFTDNVVCYGQEITLNGTPTGQFNIYYSSESNRIERFTTFGTMKFYASYSRFTIASHYHLIPIASAIVTFTASNTIASTNIPIKVGVVNADSAGQMTASGDPGGQVGAYANNGIYYSCINTDATLANWVNETTYSVDVTSAMTTVLARSGFANSLGILIQHTADGSNMTISAVTLTLVFAKSLSSSHPFHLKVIESQIFCEKTAKALAKLTCEWRI